MLETRLEILVEWGDCDPAQIVYNPNFFNWMERGLSALFSAAGFDYAEIIAANPDLRGVPLVRSEVEFTRAAKVGDLLVLSSRVVRWGTSSFDVAHDFYLDGEAIVSGRQTRVWSGVDEARELHALPLPNRIRAALEEPKTITFKREKRVSAPMR